MNHVEYQKPEWVKGKIVSGIWSKREFQNMRRQVKKQGFDVARTACGNGYEWKLPNGKLLLKAMNGNHGYLVRHLENLFV